MLLTKKIKKAYFFAEVKHGDQVDDTGEIYIHHPMRVADIVSMVTEDEDIICAAYLHDTIEDTNVTYGDLWEKFGVRIADLVYELTHEGKKDEHGYYFPRLKSKDAILIKFADRLDNLSRMEPWNEKRREQYLRKSKFWKSEL